MSGRAVFLVVAVVSLVLLVAIGAIVAGIFGIFSIVDRTDAHVCGLAYVRRSPLAVRLLGTRIAQKGFSGGSTSQANGEMRERITFTVAGSKGEAFVVSEGFRSPLESHLTVRIGRDQQSTTVYEGPFDCPQLHQRLSTP